MSREPRIALVANVVPWPPNNGATVRQFKMLKALKAHGYKVSVFGLCERKHLEQAKQRLLEYADEVYCAVSDNQVYFAWAVALAMLTGKSVSETVHCPPLLRAAVKNFFSQYPTARALVHSTNVTTLIPAKFRESSLFDMTDVDSSKFKTFSNTAKLPMKLVYSREAKLIEELEISMLDQYRHTILIADREVQELGHFTYERFKRKISVIPNGVDFNLFHPNVSEQPPKFPEQEAMFIDSSDRVLLFPGVMDYAPNIDAAKHFALEIFPSLRRGYDNLKFVIMGARPTRDVLELRRLPGVIVTGFVDSAVPYFQAAEAVVIPLVLSRGLQNKALEAMATGRPLVVYREVAAGLAAECQSDMWIADTKQQFEVAVRSILDDHLASKRRGIQAIAFVKKHHDWDNAMVKLLAILQQEA